MVSPVLQTNIIWMELNKNANGIYLRSNNLALAPPKDFYQNSELLQRIGWTDRRLNTLIVTDMLPGLEDSSARCKLTCEAWILMALEFRNQILQWKMSNLGDKI